MRGVTGFCCQPLNLGSLGRSVLMHTESVDIQTQMYSTAIPWAFTHLSLAYYKKACVSPAFVLTGPCLGSEFFGRTGWGRGPGLTLWPHPLDFPHQPLDICQYDKNGIAYTCAHICLYILEFLYTFCITSCYIWHSSETVCVCVWFTAGVTTFAFFNTYVYHFAALLKWGANQCKSSLVISLSGF